jgi:hypothetical protein
LPPRQNDGIEGRYSPRTRSRVVAIDQEFATFFIRGSSAARFALT